MSQEEKVQVPWSDIDTLLLDMDGTLLDLAFDNFFWLELVPEVYAEVRGLPPALAREQLFDKYRQVAGTLPWYCIDHWSEQLDMDIESLKHSHRHRIRYLPQAEEFLALARSHGKQLMLVTNAHHITLRIKSEQTGINALMDVVVTSHDYGVEKERPEFWDKLKREQQLLPERCLLLEDNLTVLATALRRGIGHAIAIRRPDTSQDTRDVEGFAAVDGVASLIG